MEQEYFENHFEEPQRLNRHQLAALFQRVLYIMERKKRYKETTYSLLDLANELHSTKRHISRAIAQNTNNNFRALINSYRLKAVRRKLKQTRYANKSIEEIGLSEGFASRQAFYMAFHREENVTPKEWREQHMPKEEKAK